VTLRLVQGRVRALADVRASGPVVLPSLRAGRRLTTGRYTLVAVVVLADGRSRQSRRAVALRS
jgi:hypothetical protein